MSQEKKGTQLGLTSYVLWGVISLYWKLLPNVQSLDILSYRIIWSVVFLLFFVFITKKINLLKRELIFLQKNKRIFLFVLVAAVLISANWFTFIYSVSSGKVTEASLGYYINPLVNVLLATIFLKERLIRSDKVACLLATVGVAFLVVQTGSIPWSSLVLAFTFGFYGLVKKQLPISALTGLTVETSILAPIALVYLLFFAKTPFMSYSLGTNSLLIGAGIVTAIPLLLFAEAAKRLSYVILGFLQYISPTLMLIFAIFLFHEKYPLTNLIAFTFIWLAILIFSYGNFQLYRKQKK